ncbi:UDP-N-acetylglucosamine 1-carboxyvinyltransferase [Kitasatospora sp. NPDC001261]|uniref:UDP-N-acetylglucosamine 1-carboxyvinyltransferase n=1 Tax=Kitasatospora sp. NPDC001261 TaxID=3364012 RepID=UPI003677A449
MTATTTSDRLTLRITGGRPLHGSTTVQGSKNIALHLYAAAILADQPLTLTGAPAILDTGVCAEILHRTGTHATVTDGEFETRPADSYFPVIPDDLGRRIRTTAVMAAALLTRCGKVTFPLPGGDAFCARYIDLHLAAMEAAGADVEVNRGRVRARFPGSKRLPFITTVSTRKWGPSLGATVTAMLLAARTPGTSSIHGPSIEPEVTVTAELLARSGVGITWQGTEALHVTGTDLIAGGVFPVPFDRLEAATLALAAAITGGTVHLDAFPPSGFPAGLVSVFADTGILLTAERAGTTVAVPAGLRAVEAATGPHPGYPTDVQPQLTAALTQASGTSRIDERIYSRRNSHLTALQQFGAVVNADGPVITVEGPSRLLAADVAGEDIRAVTALVLAALAAEGTSTIRGMYHLRRGYGDLLAKLSALGADLTINQELL